MKNQFLHLIAAAITLLFTTVTFAQVINLGTAANFVIFTPTGAVGNTGNSQVTGNVGTNNGGITGFGNVNGVMHNSDGATASAANNLNSAYLQLNTITPTAAHAPLLGNGETLNAGVYDISGLTTLSNTLNLDAQGNANAVFIFKISAVFNSNASSQVKLVNGALACNIFWKVEGAVNLATLTLMKGTIVAQGAIDLSTGVQLEGRMLSTTGAITINGITAKIPAGCGSPVLTGPVAPDLGSANCYAIFSANGPVTNAAGSVTTITGDVGTNVTLTTGYNPLLVNGTIHPIPDVSTSMAAADLLNARTYLNGLAADIELLYPAVFGKGLVLTPHTYVMNAGTTLTDTLYLNAEGNADAVFVIKIYGAFNAVTLAAVKLTNGTQAKNVFWIINGAVVINNFADLKGTIVCNNGAIDLKTGAKLEGRAMTTVGSLSTATLTAIMPPGCSTLPLSLVAFSGHVQNKDAVLDWTTVNEKNTLQFDIEQSLDTRNYTKVGTIGAAGASNGEKNYSFVYKNVTSVRSSIVYYRLKMIDKDGRFTYSGVVAIQLNDKATFIHLYPNPVQENAALSISLTKEESVTYTVIDNAGKILFGNKANLEAGLNTININVKGLAVGLYTINIRGTKTNEWVQFIKQ